MPIQLTTEEQRNELRDTFQKFHDKKPLIVLQNNNDIIKLEDRLEEHPKLTDSKEFDIIRKVYFQSITPRGQEDFNIDSLERLDRMLNKKRISSR